jgi:DNA-binding NtrC family response regulator
MDDKASPAPADGTAPVLEAARRADAPCEALAYVIDDEVGICNLLSKMLQSSGVESETFHTAKQALAALDRRRPAVIFLDVALLQSDAVEVVQGLGARRYGGVVHLMSGGHPSLIEAVERAGARDGLRFGEPLHKPFRRDTFLALVQRTGLAKSH